MEPRQRYGLIDFDGLRDLFNFRSISELANAYRGRVEELMKKRRYSRDGKWRRMRDNPYNLNNLRDMQ